MRVKDGDLYVSSVEGHLVSHFGSAMAGAKAPQIGAVPEFKGDPVKGVPQFSGMKWNIEEIVRIPRESYVANLKDYDRAIAGKALRLRTKAEYDEYREKELAEEEKVLEEFEKAKLADEAKE